MRNKQYFDIKYPFTSNGLENYDFDLNRNEFEAVRSKIVHVLFTPKGSRLRSPEFGTDLIKYIFEPNDEESWNGVESEIRKTVSRWVRGVTVNSVSVMASEDRMGTYVKLEYTVDRDGEEYSDKFIVEL
jgi:phage baseplate assembly protein W